MKNTILIALAAVATAVSVTVVHAGPVTNFNLLNVNGVGANVNNVASVDWSETGSGAALGVNLNPASAGFMKAGDTFTFLYQSFAVNFPALSTPAGLVTTGTGGAFGAGQWELTMAARITERVTSFTNPVPGVFIATFEPVIGTASFFLDNVAQGGGKANVATGHGFDDGREIARFDITSDSPADSNFVLVGKNSGSGGTQFHFDIKTLPANFVDAAFLTAAAPFVGFPIMDMHFNANQNLPAGTSRTIAFHMDSSNNNGNVYADKTLGTICNPPGPPNACDLLLKVDGASQLSVSVPEPGTMILMAAGLLGVGVGTRRRSKAARLLGA